MPQTIVIVILEGMRSPEHPCSRNDCSKQEPLLNGREPQCFSPGGVLHYSSCPCCYHDQLLESCRSRGLCHVKLHTTCALAPVSLQPESPKPCSAKNAEEKRFVAPGGRNLILLVPHAQAEAVPSLRFGCRVLGDRRKQFQESVVVLYPSCRVPSARRSASFLICTDFRTPKAYIPS